ncbi:unnamed protein product, partial [Effrenium voratum]
MEIANLDVEIRDKTAEIEDAEDEETVARLTAEIEQLKDRKQKLKERAREEDRKAKAIKQAGQFKLTSENVLSQEWHDSRYYGARKAGVKDEEYQNDILEGVETEGVEDIGGGKVRVLTGDARVAKKSQLRQADQTKFVQAARRYRSLTQAEVSRFKVETKEDEAKVMEKKRVNLFAKRLRHMTPQKKLERKQRVAAAKKRRTVCRSMVWHGKCKDGDKCKFDHDVAKYEKANLCPQFIHGHCRQLTKCKMNHDAVEREICRILKRQKKVKRKKSEAQTGQKGASRTSGPADSDSGGSAMEQEDAKSTVRLIEAKDVKSTVRLVEAKDVKDPSSFEAPYAEQGEWISMNFDTGAAVTAIPKKLSDYLELKGDPNSSSYKTASGELLPDEGGAVMRGYTNDCCGRSIEGRLVDVHRLLVSGSAVSKKNVVILDGNEGWIIPRDSKIGKGVRATRDDLINQNYKEAKMITKMYERKGIFLFDLWMDKHTKMNGVDAKELGAVQGEESAEGEGGRKPKLLRSPVTMTVDEIEEHETQATIHRTWCGHCMRARGLHERHASEAQKGKDERGLPIISMDYFWMGKDSKNRDVPDPEGELPSLQIKDEHTGFVWASVVPAKGADLYAVNFAIQSVEESGYRRIVLKSDNESSIKALKSAIKEGIKSVEIVMEEGKTGDSQSNGSCEVAVRETKRQVRAMKSALEEKMGLKIHSRWKRPSVTFGRVWFKPRSYVRLAYDTMREGLFLGAHGRNGDALTEGVKGGSVKRVPDETKFDQMCGTPWKMRPKRPEDLVAPAVALPAVPEGVRLMPEPSDKGSGQVRNLYVKKADVEGNFTPGCDGCNAIVGLPARSHSVECRTLVEQRLMETEEGRDCVMRARKRKADAAGKEDKSGDVVVPAIEGMPDMEEVAASAVGDRWKILRKAFTELSPRTEGDVALESAMQEREAGASSSGSAGAQPSGADPAISFLEKVCSEVLLGLDKTFVPETIHEMNQLYQSLGMSGADVAEIYNPKRFTSNSNAFGLQPGFAIDLTLQKDDEGEARVLDRVTTLWAFQPTAESEQSQAYLEQHRNGRYFLHEHAKPSRSWKEPCIEKLQAMDGVYTVQAPMCKWHMKAEDGQGVGFVRKETCYVTNSAEMANYKALEGRCEGSHRHVHLINGRAREAQVYPPKLVNAILRGIKKELMNAGEISELSSITAGPSPDETSSEPTESFFDPDVQTEGVFFESVTGTPLKTEKVWEARREEMTWVKKQDLYEVVDEQVSKSGQPLKLRLIDISRAHFGQARRRVFCNLGEEIPGKCALLKRSMYGTLDAASIWQHTYADVLKNNIKQCNAWPALFYQEDSDLRFMVHGDDFISLGDDFAQNFLEKVLSEKFEYRVDGQIGPEAADGTAMCVLNRVLEFNKDTGILTYADPRNAEDIIRALNLEESKSVSTPAEKQKLTDVLAEASVSLRLRHRTGGQVLGQTHDVANFVLLGATQAARALPCGLSSGESEFYALVKAGAMGLGLQAMLDEWQIPT